MTRNTKRRLALYGTAVLGLLAFGYMGWIYEAPPNADILERLVYESAAAEDYDRARKHLAEMERRFPEDVRGPLMAGWLEAGVGDLAAADSAYRRALPLCRNDDQRREIFTTLADLLRRQGSPDAALAALGETENQYGKDLKTRHARVLALLDKRAFEDALGVVGEMDEEGGVNPHARRLRKQIQELQASTQQGESLSRSPGQ